MHHKRRKPRRQTWCTLCKIKRRTNAIEQLAVSTRRRLTGAITESPTAYILQPMNTRTVAAGAGAKLTRDDFHELARKNPPPQSWHEEDMSNL